MNQHETNQMKQDQDQKLKEWMQRFGENPAPTYADAISAMKVEFADVTGIADPRKLHDISSMEEYMDEWRGALSKLEPNLALAGQAIILAQAIQWSVGECQEWGQWKILIEALRYLRDPQCNPDELKEGWWDEYLMENHVPLWADEKGGEESGMAYRIEWDSEIAVYYLVEIVHPEVHKLVPSPFLFHRLWLKMPRHNYHN